MRAGAAAFVDRVLYRLVAHPPHLPLVQPGHVQDRQQPQHKRDPLTPSSAPVGVATNLLPSSLDGSGASEVCAAKLAILDAIADLTAEAILLDLAGEFEALRTLPGGEPTEADLTLKPGRKPGGKSGHS